MVDQQAYILHSSWLQVGWELWQKLPHKRDYFLGLPTADLGSMRLLEARYADGVAMSRALLGGLVDEKGSNLLLSPRAGDFWTGHSDRAFLPSVGGAIASINQSWLNDVGRWAQETSVGYVRTQLFRVRSIQQQVASLCRSPASDISRLCEEDVYASWLNHLCDQGCGDEHALKQVLVLTAYADGARIEHTAVTPLVEDKSLIAEPCEEIVLDDEPVSQTPSKLETHDPPDLPLGTYVVSVSSRTEFRRLHVTGGCPRVPGSTVRCSKC